MCSRARSMSRSATDRRWCLQGSECRVEGLGGEEGRGENSLLQACVCVGGWNQGGTRVEPGGKEDGGGECRVSA